MHTFLFATINDYIKGGKFSKSYLNVLAKEYNRSGNIYLINQPSQYNGALLLGRTVMRRKTPKKSFTLLLTTSCYNLIKKEMLTT